MAKKPRRTIPLSKNRSPAGTPGSHPKPSDYPPGSLPHTPESESWAAPIYSRDSAGRELPRGVGGRPLPRRRARSIRRLGSTCTRMPADRRDTPAKQWHPHSTELLAAAIDGRPQVETGKLGPWGGIAGRPVRSLRELEAGRVLVSGQPAIVRLGRAAVGNGGAWTKRWRAGAVALVALTLAGSTTPGNDGSQIGYSRGADLDVARSMSLRLPAWAWRCWAADGWRRHWSPQKSKTARRWLARIGVAGSLRSWHRSIGSVARSDPGAAMFWTRRDGARARLFGAAEWAARSGITVPAWLVPPA